jgi:hypothetical protein
MKARKDSVLKSRALKSREFGDKLFGWISEPKTKTCAGGATYAMQRLSQIGITVKSEATINEFYSWWGLRKAYENAAGHAEEQKDLMLRFDPHDVDRAEKFGDFCFLQEAIALKDAETFIGLGMLREKRKQSQLKGEDLELQRRRFEFSAAKSVKEHFAELKSILSDRSLNEEAQIEGIRLRLFGKGPNESGSQESRK